jgi:hypothetical protein
VPFLAYLEVKKGLMPHKDPDKKRTYHREYTRRRRAAVKPGNGVVLNPEAQEAGAGNLIKPNTQALAGSPRCINWNRPYFLTVQFPRPDYLQQDGYWFNPETGELMGAVK